MPTQSRVGSLELLTSASSLCDASSDAAGGDTTGIQITVNLHNITDFSGLNIVVNVWDNTKIQLRNIQQGLVVFRHFNACYVRCLQSLPNYLFATTFGCRCKYLSGIEGLVLKVYLSKKNTRNLIVDFLI